MSKLEAKLRNYRNAVTRLKEAVQEWQHGHSSDVIRDGVIQRFEITYELAWKATKDYLQSIGIVDVNSPKAVVREAYVQKLLTTEQRWVQIISDRNLTTHMYSEELANEVAERIADHYVEEFEQLLQKLQS